MIDGSDINSIPATGANHPHLDGQHGGQNPRGALNYRSQPDRSDNITSTFDRRKSTDWGQADRELSSGTGWGENFGEKNRGAGDKEYVSGLEGLRKRSDSGADYIDRGVLGTGATGAPSGSQHYRRTSDADGTDFWGSPGKGYDNFGGYRAEHNTMPSQNAANDSQQHHPANPERVKNYETEEVLREKEDDFPVHHVQHHTQPDLDKETKDEIDRDRGRIHTHANKPDEGSTPQHEQICRDEDSQDQGDNERVVIDRGEAINEREHHHVHHIVQPIIEKETIEQHRIHTVIPVHQVTHEAPVVHKSQTHAPVSMEYFAQKGGQIVGGLKYDEVRSTVLRNGQCTREVEGEDENIAQNLTGTHILENADHFAQRSEKHEPGADSGDLGERDESGRQSFGTGVTGKGNFGAGGTGDRND
ncbi:hypothetical protein H0H87_007236, partial [Tephrocybe sp. NHM501043]